MPGIEDWINKPLEIVQNIYSSSPTPVECHKKITEYFTKRITECAITKVPSLNVCPSHNLPANSLVRFRCMVQDMFDPEFFMGSYEVVHVPSQRRYMRTGMYKDIADCQSSEEVDLDSPKNKTMDRLTFYTVSIPGESEWIQKGYSEEVPVSTCPTTSNGHSRQKRSYSADSEVESDNEESTSMDTDSEKANENKRSRVSNTTNNESSSPSTSQVNQSPFPALNLPIPESKGFACIVKIYEQSLVATSSPLNSTGESLKVNDVIEVVGILSVDPSLGHLDMELKEAVSNIGGISEFIEETIAHNPPPSLVPRLHAVVIRKLDHVNPHIPWDVKAESNNDIRNNLLAQAPQLRAELHSFLTQALMGDQLVAEYLLCHLISSIYVRKDVVALGKFSLNILYVPIFENYTVKLYQAISQLVTKSHWFPLSLTNLNTSTLTPKKDFTQNRLRTGILQLSAQTHLILDETALSVGQLQALGVKNMTALGNLIHWQRVEYDFSFNRMEFATDIAVLVLSEGKSLLPSDCRIPLLVSSTLGGPEKVFSELQNQVTEKWLESARCYLTLLKLVNYTMSEELQRNVQEDFIQMRRENKTISADDLHSLLVLARFLSLSLGETTLSKSSWEKAKSLERERKQRLNAAQQASV